MQSVGRRGQKTLETVLGGDSGIRTRQFALQPPGVFSLDAQGLNEAFEREAPLLANSALEKALAKVDMSAVELDAMFVCTCTGYLCPGVSSHLAEKAGVREDAHLQDIGGLGCGAAIPTLQAASCYLAANPDATVAVVAVEICSAAFFLCDDPGVLISACLFGDGASASIWTGRGSAGDWRASGFHSLHRPVHRERIRFVNQGGYLRNQLHRDVPSLAADAVGELFQRAAIVPDAVIAHPGGRDVIEALEDRLGLPLVETRRVLAEYGNLSSPSVMVALEQRLLMEYPGQLLWLTAFGAGFAAYCCQIQRKP
ncbi:MAG: type III polyketide synthase [Terrimicrobiaceae bacterium]